MIIARQSTARTVTVGPVLDADGVAVTDGVVGDFKISKNGGAPAALNGSATLTHRHTGFYSLALTASDLDTVGQAEVVIDDTTNACPMKDITVVEEAVYDALFAASALGYVANAPVNVAQFGGSNGTFSGGRPEVNASHWGGTAVGSTEVRANLINIAGSAVNTSAAQLGVNVVNFGGSAGTFSSGRPEVNTTHFAGQTITCSGGVTIPAATLASTANITAGTITTVTNLTNAPTNGDLTSTMKASVQTEAEEALQTYHLDHLIASADPGAVVANSSFLAKLVSKSGTPAFSSYDNTTDSLEALRDNVGTAGAGLTAADDAVISAIAALNNITAASVWAVGTRTLTAGTNIDGSTFTAIPWNDNWDAEVQSEVQDAIEANNLDHLVKIAVDTDFATTVHVDSVVGQMAQTSDGGYSRATDSLEAIRDRGDAAWTTATGFSTHSASDVWAVATRVLTAGTNIVLAKGTGVTGFNDLSAAQVNTEVDTALADIHLDHLIASADPGSIVANSSLWAALTSKSSTPSYASYSNQTDSLEALRDRGDAAWITATGFSTHSASDVWAVATRVLTAGTNIVLAKGTGVTGFNDLSAAQVNTEVDTALADIHLDHLIAVADPGGVVADSSFLSKLVSKSATPSFASYSNQTDSLEAIRDRGDAAWITATGFSTHSAADVWGVGTRTLTAIDEDATTLDLDATIRAAVGLASANLDTQIDAIPTAAENAAGLLDLSNGVETSLTVRGALRLVSSVLFGKSSNGGKTFRDFGDTKDRVTGTMDASNNRVSVSRDST